MSVTVDLKKLLEALNTGKRMTGATKGQTFTMATEDGNLVCSFGSDVVQYGVAIPAAGDLQRVYCDAATLIKMLGRKVGEATIANVAGGSGVKITSKRFSAELPTVHVPEDESNIPSPFNEVAKDAEAGIDASSLASIPKSAFRIFRAIRDNITKEELSATASWAGSKMTVMIADSFHGVVISIDLPAKVRKAKLTLPTQAFLKVVEIGANVMFDGSTVTAQSDYEFLKCSVKATTNQNITISMMESLLNERRTTTFLVGQSSVNQALSSCLSVADETSSVGMTFNVSKKALRLSVASDGGSVSESIGAQETNGKSRRAKVVADSLKDIVACMNETFEISMTTGIPILFESASEGLTIRGACSTIK